MDKIQQNFQRLIEPVCTGEHITGGVVPRVGISVGPHSRKPGKGVAIFTLEQLVFQVMGNAFRDLLGRRLVTALKTVVHGAIAGSENCLSGTAPLFGIQIDRQPGRMTVLVVAVSGAAAGNQLRFHPSPPPFSV